MYFCDVPFGFFLLATSFLAAEESVVASCLMRSSSIVRPAEDCFYYVDYLGNSTNLFFDFATKFRNIFCKKNIL